MKIELAAGGIVVTFYNSQWYVLIMKDLYGNWTFPKGKIEIGEETLEAAKREIFEEVGVLHLTLIQKLNPIEYFYTVNEKIHKKIQYFLFFSVDKQPLTVQKEEGIIAAQWTLFSTAAALIGYHDSNIPLLTQTEQIVKAYTIA